MALRLRKVAMWYRVNIVAVNIAKVFRKVISLLIKGRQQSLAILITQAKIM